MGSEVAEKGPYAYAEGVDTVARRIDSLLAGIEERNDVRIPYACESGSRAWGFASPDSDYDIRFLFVRPENDYLSVIAAAEVIDLPLEGELDSGGWDVRKAAGLLGKSNGALLEWLHSPIVYREEPGFLARWRKMAGEVFSPRASADHYRGLAKGMLQGPLAGDRVRAKDYFYALRAVLAAKWVLAGRGIPPVPFGELLAADDGAPAERVAELLARKAESVESDRMERVPELDRFLKGAMAEIESGIESAEIKVPDRKVLDGLLRRVIRGGGGVPRAVDFTLARVRQPDLLMFDTVAGSRAYGTVIEGSDEDRRGVFVAPRAFLCGLESIGQVSDERSDETCFELGKFVEMLLRNNPNALELLGMPDDCIRYQHPLFAKLEPGLFLSKLCARTFGEYAMGQIRKARGLNKKIVNPEPERRRPMLDFCRVPAGQGSTPVAGWLAERGLRADDCGLTAVRNAAGLFAIYHDPGHGCRGMVSPKDPDALVFSSVPVEAEPIGWMHFNQDAFKAHCKAHREYWEWAALRNEERYANNARHGRGYDSKNLMHTLRLLDMAGEIAREGVIRVRRTNRDFLLKVRAGEFAYEDLAGRADEMLAEVVEAYGSSDLPDAPDRDRANELLVEIRAEFNGGR